MTILTGLKVIDAATFIAGPCAATVLGDFGAEVIKVEPPGGDGYRDLIDLPGFPKADVDYYWQMDNRNKRGIALDLGNEADKAVLVGLIGQADVFITNHPLPVRRKFGLTYGDIAPLNPRLIYASMTGFGEQGPEADKRGFDLSTYWARSGLMHMVRPDMAGPPAPSVAGQGDHPTGLALFGAIMLALFERQSTGKGRQVHTSLVANGIWSNACFAQAALSGATAPQRRPRHAPTSAVVNTYQSKDRRWFMTSALQPENDWRRLTEAVGHPEWQGDSRFSTLEARTRNAAELVALLDPIFAGQDWAYWRDRFAELGFQAGPVYDIFDAVTDPQAIASGVVADAASNPALDQVIDSPLWIEGVEKTPAAPAPTVDQHGADIREAIARGRDPWQS